MTLDFPLLIDGGLSNELERLGGKVNSKLWTAELINKQPELIIQAHYNYLNAGARCIITSSYQATIPGLIEAGYSKNEAVETISASVKLAQHAVEKYLKNNPFVNRPLVAASIGPYGAYLADGSEYTGNYNISTAELKEFHSEKIKLLDKSGADLLACETVPSFSEAKVLAEILAETHTPSWVSFSCKNENEINDGTPIEKCVELFSNHVKVFAVGVNCTSPQYITGLVKRITPLASNKKIIAYPNSGEIYNPKTKQWASLSYQNTMKEMVDEWLKLGVEILGGCCRIGPEQIKAINLVLGN